MSAQPDGNPVGLASSGEYKGVPYSIYVECPPSMPGRPYELVVSWPDDEVSTVDCDSIADAMAALEEIV